MANRRGFSGGQKDLFEGILQAGSTIVENIRTYKQPAFVYIPMTGELRGDETFFKWKEDPRNYQDQLQELQVQKVLLSCLKLVIQRLICKHFLKDLLPCSARLNQQVRRNWCKASLKFSISVPLQSLCQQPLLVHQVRVHSLLFVYGKSICTGLILQQVLLSWHAQFKIILVHWKVLAASRGAEEAANLAAAEAACL